jgi:hypothetical protein
MIIKGSFPISFFSLDIEPKHKIDCQTVPGCSFCAQVALRFLRFIESSSIHIILLSSDRKISRYYFIILFASKGLHS